MQQVAQQVISLPYSVSGGVRWGWHKYDLSASKMICPIKPPADLPDEPMPDRETKIPVAELVWNTRDMDSYTGYKILMNGDVAEISGDGLQKRLDWLMQRKAWIRFEVAEYQDVKVITGLYLPAMCSNHKCNRLFAPHELIDMEVPQGHIDTRYCPDCVAKGAK